MLSKDKLKQVFKMFDEDDSGTITIDELMSFFNTKGEDAYADWKKMIKECGTAKAGEITFEDFIKIMDQMVK